MQRVDQEMEDLITSVGAETFIKYYKIYQAHKDLKDNSSIRIAFKENGEKWSPSTINTKASGGKRIFVKGYEQDVLHRIINNSIKLNEDIINQAKDYLILCIEDEVIKSLPIDIETEKIRLIKLRIQQSLFRKMVVKHWEKCAITKCENQSILIASHIKPWKDSDNLEKLDPFNGILLSPIYDKLFDKYLISFDDNGNILISDELTNNDLVALNVKKTDKLNFHKLEKRHLDYLIHHRNIFFLKNEI
ncbi:HNH endonuclease [Flavobacterium sp. UBA4854]|uniref:HNH endonuclease n=1 Tax=Flavobacterium sp. UBA4854 TaxID=1946548 RepID=UPI00257F196F|nr:HNH endonuclease [Flavobacterium sp. UBA4854]